MKSTIQKLIFCDSRLLSNHIPSKSINLIVTSPPYPMIKMWDDLFYTLNSDITTKLINTNPTYAFDLMHEELNKVWAECIKVLKDDGVICINIGDATRNTNGFFQIFSNHTKIINFFTSKGFSQIPSIIWHKPTNSPNKFMGSGMLPVGAYNTLEHEHILFFRKQKRVFSKLEKDIRKESAFFQNERNLWCQDIWRIKGVRQKNDNDSRSRNAAFPLEIPYRLIALNSISGDTVLDPFGGTGTTTLASIALGRNSYCVEIEKQFETTIFKKINNSIEFLNQYNKNRFIEQALNIKEREKKHKENKYKNLSNNISVVTSQEQKIKIPKIVKIYINDSQVKCEYK